MSDNMNIAIKVDPGRSLATTKEIEQALAGLEAKGPAVSSSITKGLAAVEASADKASGAVGKLTKETANVGMLGKRFEELGKSMLQAQLHAHAQQMSDAVSEATDGIIDLNNAMIGFQLAGPAGAVAGAVAGKAFSMLAEESANTAHQFEMLEVSSRGLIAAIGGFNFDHLNQELLKASGSSAGLILKITQATAALGGLSHARTIMALSAVDAGFVRTNAAAAAAAAAIADVQSALDRTRKSQIEYHKEIDKVNAVNELGLYSGGEYASALHSVEVQFGHVTAAATKTAAAITAVSLATRDGGFTDLLYASSLKEFNDRKQAANRAAHPWGPGVAPQARSSDFPSEEQLTSGATGGPAEMSDAVIKANAELKAMHDLISGELINDGKQFASTLVDAANGADVSWSNFAESMLVNFEKMIAQALVLKALTGSVTGAAGPGGGYGGLLGAIGFATGGDMIPKAATGADWMVGGKGGIDQNLAMFRVSKGESIHVRTEQQRNGGGSGPAPAAPAAPIIINNHVDVERRALAAMDGHEFDKKLLNAARRQAGAMKSILSR